MRTWPAMCSWARRQVASSTSGGQFLRRRVAQGVAPGGAPGRIPTQVREVATRIRDALAQHADLFLGHAGEDVGDQVRDFTALADAVRGDAERLQFLATAHPLQE